jgi:hypothetical protein
MSDGHSFKPAGLPEKTPSFLAGDGANWRGAMNDAIFPSSLELDSMTLAAVNTTLRDGV